MKTVTAARALLLLLGCSLLTSPTAQSAGDPIGNACAAIETMISRTGDSTLIEFARNHMTPSAVDALSTDELVSLLGNIRRTVGDYGGVRLALRGPGQGQAIFDKPQEQVTVDFDVDPSTGLISRIELAAVTKDEQLPPFSWDNVAQRLKEEETNGFSGTVLLFRGDSIVLEQGYGSANREKDIPNQGHTIFAIGSTPIDFTHAAILKLEENGELSTSDPISKYIDNVPDDKMGITLQYLMTGKSGLPNFHDTDEDDDPDLTWIDRATAIKRIMGQQLLFTPGTAERHSHSAWVLLAAIVEIVSDKPYDTFLRETFFDKAGMHRTGNYPLTKQFDPTEVAVGYGSSRIAPTNSPQYWGPTSWLVMGSGGMVSTVGDLYRWHEAMRRGDLLGPSALAKYPVDAAGVGGSDRGFLNWFVYEGDTGFVLCSNAHDQMNDIQAKVAQALERLVEHH